MCSLEFLIRMLCFDRAKLGDHEYLWTYLRCGRAKNCWPRQVIYTLEQNISTHNRPDFTEGTPAMAAPGQGLAMGWAWALISQRKKNSRKNRNCETKCI